jgi:hypothetical protein
MSGLDTYFLICVLASADVAQAEVRLLQGAKEKHHQVLSRLIQGSKEKQ